MANISRLRLDQIQNGLDIDAADINAELDQLVTSYNTNDTSLANITSSAATATRVLAGTKLRLQPGSIASLLTANGQIAAETTTGQPFVRVNGANNVLYHAGNFNMSTTVVKAPVWQSASTVRVISGTTVTDDTGLRVIKAASNLDVVLSASGALGLDTGSEAADTWYYLWLCEGTGGVTAIFSTSTTAPTLPTGYTTYKALIGEFRNDSSSNLTKVISVTPNHVRLLTPNAIASAAIPTTATALNLISAVPPTATAAIMFIDHYNNTSGGSLYLTPGGGTEFVAGANSLSNLSKSFEITLPVTSTPSFTWRVDGGSGLSALVLGYLR